MISTAAFSEGDAQQTGLGGNLRPEAAVRLSLQEGSNRHIAVVTLGFK